VPVGATYEPETDRIIAVFTRFAATGFASGDLFYTTIAAGTAGGTSNAFTTPVRFSGETSVSTQSVACEDSNSNVHCPVFIIGTDSLRSIWRFEFSVSSNGTLRNKTGATSWRATDFPIGLVGPGPTNAGAFVAAVKRTDGPIYTSSNPDAAGSWGSWSNTGKTGKNGPAIGISEASTNDVILNAP